VAERKNSSLELQGQLSKGIFDLYSSAYGLANESLKKILNDEARIYLNNRRFFYAAKSMIKMKDLVLDEFNKTGEGYGKAIAYLGLAVDSLNNGIKDIKKIKHLIDMQDYENLKASYEKLGQEMIDKNHRIYFQLVPELSTLPKLDKKIMVNPQQIPDNLNSSLENASSVLDSLVPKEIKGMIENYKKGMMEYISENLNKYQNESEIMAFLTQLDLPYSLETVLSQSEISESLWKKISEVQQKGGSLFMMNNISNLEKKGQEIAKRISDMQAILANEAEEDNKYKNMYGDRWNRTSSSLLNGNYLKVLSDYSNKLEVARKCDEQIKIGIMDNMKYFEILGLPKHQISNKIPVKTDSNAIKNCEEANALRKDLDALDVIKEKCMDIISKIFTVLNEENVSPQFIKVLQKKTTEKAVLSDNKPKYDVMFKELDAVSEEIKIMKLSIIAKNEVFLRVKKANFKPNEQNEKFFRELEEYYNIYNQKMVNLQQGMNFYNEFSRRLIDISNHITDFLTTRDIEKNDIIRFLTGSGNQRINAFNNPQGSDNLFFNNNNNYWDFTNTNTNQNYLNQSSYMDPRLNLITNISPGMQYNNPNSNPMNYDFNKMNLNNQNWQNK
jgi:hypothetical protein